MATVSNSLVFKEDWAVRLQQELDEPNKWKDICQVEYTNSKILHNPYLSDPTVQTGTRGTPYSYQAITHTDESTIIDDYRVIPQFIDRADLAQLGYVEQMELARRQGILLNERIEAAVFASYGSMTTFDGDEIGGSAGSISLTVNNVDAVIRGLRREIAEASGQTLFERNGGFVVWRPSDLELVEEFAQANGFNLADQTLRSGVVGRNASFNYMGLNHYSSNLLTGGHIVAGVNKSIHLGILKATYGQIMVDDKDPAQTSGVGIVSRVDFKPFVWTRMKPVVFDVRLV